VRFNSNTCSLGGVGAAGVIALGKEVVVGAALFGRKIELKPAPANVPLKLANTPVQNLEVSSVILYSKPS